MTEENLKSLTLYEAKKEKAGVIFSASIFLKLEKREKVAVRLAKPMHRIMVKMAVVSITDIAMSRLIRK